MMKKLEELGSEKEAPEAQNPSLEFIKMKGGKSHRVEGANGRSSDSMLAAYKDRLTYTFIFEGEVASIHFDRLRGEIFFKGHNIRNMELSENQLLALGQLSALLERDEEGKPLQADYEATLARLLADK